VLLSRATCFTLERSGDFNSDDVESPEKLMGCKYQCGNTLFDGIAAP
jgi:hypothetical protein